jgi:hypothetical protein
MRTRILLPLVALLLAHSGGAIAEVIVTTDKPVYEVGEIVLITARNAGPEDESLVSSPAFAIWNLDTEKCVHGCVGLPVVTPFPVGATISMEWDTGLEPDAPGNYLVRVALTDGPSLTYVLASGVSNDLSSWATLKSRYR